MSRPKVQVFVLVAKDGSETQPMIMRAVFDQTAADINAKLGAGTAWVESRDWYADLLPCDASFPR